MQYLGILICGYLIGVLLLLGTVIITMLVKALSHRIEHKKTNFWKVVDTIFFGLIVGFTFRDIGERLFILKQNDNFIAGVFLVAGIIFVYFLPRFLSIALGTSEIPGHGISSNELKNILFQYMADVELRVDKLGRILQSDSYGKFNSSQLLPGTMEQMKFDGLSLILLGKITQNQKIIEKGKLVLTTLPDFREELIDLKLDHLPRSPPELLAKYKERELQRNFTENLISKFEKSRNDNRFDDEEMLRIFEETKREFEKSKLDPILAEEDLLKILEHERKYGSLMSQLSSRRAENLQIIESIFIYFNIYKI